MNGVEEISSLLFLFFFFLDSIFHLEFLLTMQVGPRDQIRLASPLALSYIPRLTFKTPPLELTL